MAVNRLQFDVLNDTMGIFNLEVSAFEDDSMGTKLSAFHTCEYFERRFLGIYL